MLPGCARDVMTRLTAHTVRDNLSSYGSSLGHLNEGVQIALDLLPFPAFGGSVNPLLQPPYRLLLRGPVALLAHSDGFGALVRSVSNLTVYLPQCCGRY